MADQSIDLEREKIERETEQIKQVLSGRLVIDSSEGEYSSEEESDHEEKLTAIASPVEPFRSSVSPRISNAGSRASSQVSRDTLILTPHTVEGVRSRPSSGLVVAGPSSVPDDGYQQEGEDQTEDEVQGLIQDLEPEEVLELNQNYQEYIHDMLNRVQLMLAQNRERQTALKSELTVSDTGSEGRGRTTHKLWSFFKPYFKDSYGNGPPPNPESLHKREEKSISPFVTQSQKWSAQNNKTLYAAVRSDGMQKKTRPLMNKLEIYTRKLRDGAEGSDRKELQKKVQDIREDINKITCADDTELLGDRLDTHDWDKISTVDFDGVQTPSSCQLQWQNVVHPSINQKNWTEQETSRLEAIAAAHGAEDWARIAQELGTGRTAIQCLRKYQTDINTELRKTKWSPEEDALLTELVEKLKVGNYIPYQQIAYFMEGRTISQCCHRWLKTLDPNVVKGKWSIDEDIALLTAVAKFGAKDWWKIQDFVPGRTDAQVRERFMNVLDPEIRRGPFTLGEDKQLMALYEKYGPAWSTIANEIPGRTDCMILRRFELLLKQRNMTYLPLVRKPNAPVERHSDRTMAKYLGISMPELLKRREIRLKEEEQEKGQVSIKDKKPNKEKLYRLIELYKQKKNEPEEPEPDEPEQKPDRKTKKIHLLLTRRNKGGVPRRDPRLDTIEAGILELLRPPPEQLPVKPTSGRPRRHKTNRDVLVKMLAASAPPSKPIFTHLLKALHIDIPGALGMIKERQKQHAAISGTTTKIKDRLEVRRKQAPPKPPVIQQLLIPVPTFTVVAGNQPGQAVQSPATPLSLQQVRTATSVPAAQGIQILQAPILQQKPVTVAQLTATGQPGANIIQLPQTAVQQTAASVGAQAVPKDNPTAAVPVSKADTEPGPSTVPKAGSDVVATDSLRVVTTAGSSATATSTAVPSAVTTASPRASPPSTAGPSVAVAAVPTAGPSAVPVGASVSGIAKPQAAQLPQVVNVMLTGKPEKPGETAANVGQFLVVLPAGMKMIRPPTLVPAVQFQSVQLGGAAQQGIRAPLPIASSSTVNTAGGTGATVDTTLGTGTTANTTLGTGTTANTTLGTGTTANTTLGTGTTANTTQGTSATENTTQGTGTAVNTTQGPGTTANTTQGTGTAVNTTQGPGTPANITQGTDTPQTGQDRPEGLVSLAQVAAKVAADEEAKAVAAGEKDSTTTRTAASSPSPTRDEPKRKTRASARTASSPARSPSASTTTATTTTTKTKQTVPKILQAQPAKSAPKQTVKPVPIVARAAPTVPVVPVQILPAPQRAKVVRAPSSRKVSKVKLLAPNSATLNGFKSLLLGRKKLVAEFERLISAREARRLGLGPQTQAAAMATPSHSGWAGFDGSGSETSPRPGRSEPSTRLPSSAVNPHKDSYCYKMLKNRFEALFLWPALLSTVTVDVKPSQMSKKGIKPRPAHLNFARKKRQKLTREKRMEASKTGTETGETPVSKPAAATSGPEVKKRSRRGQKAELHGEGDEAPRRSTRLASRPPIRFKRKYTKRKVEHVTLEDEEEKEEEEEDEHDEDQEPLQNGSTVKAEEENAETSGRNIENEASVPAEMETEGPACNSTAESPADNVETGVVNGGTLPQKDCLGQKTLLASSPEKTLRSVGGSAQTLKEAGHVDLSQSDNDAPAYEKYDRYETGKKSSASEELGSPSQGGTPGKRPLEDSSASTPPGEGKRKHKKRRTIRDMLSSSGSGKE